MDFNPFTGPGPCPKCGSSDYLIRYHDKGMSEFDGPGSCCWGAPGWPLTELGEPAETGSEEHLHRVCETCGYEVVEGLATPEQRQPPSPRYEMFTGIEQIRIMGAKGWKIVAAWGMGVQVGAIMEDCT